MPCSGKSFYSNYIGSKVKIPFYDTDTIFYKKYKFKPIDFITKYGMGIYRKYEYYILLEYIDKYINKNVILATGGGIIEYYKSFELMQKFYNNTIKNNPFINNIIYLSLIFDEYKKRYNLRDTRLHYTNKQMENIYNSRITKFNKIYNIKLNTNNPKNINHNIFEILTLLI